MTPLFTKLNLADHAVIHVLGAPESFESELARLEGVAIRRAVRGKLAFALAFVTTRDQVQSAAAKLTAAADGDVVLWMAYPKASSKRYRCDFNRDTGWQCLGDAGYEPVRQVAIDDDWSALRFRKVEFITSMRRNPDGAISTDGRKKARAQRRADGR